MGDLRSMTCSFLHSSEYNFMNGGSQQARGSYLQLLHHSTADLAWPWWMSSCWGMPKEQKSVSLQTGRRFMFGCAVPSLTFMSGVFGWLFPGEVTLTLQKAELPWLMSTCLGPQWPPEGPQECLKCPTRELDFRGGGVYYIMSLVIIQKCNITLTGWLANTTGLKESPLSLKALVSHTCACAL